MLPRPLPRAKWVWLGVVALPSALDYWADRGEPDLDTFSEQIRAAFHTDTPAGRVVFTLALAAGSTWLHQHITKPV